MGLLRVRVAENGDRHSAGRVTNSRLVAGLSPSASQPSCCNDDRAMQAGVLRISRGHPHPAVGSSELTMTSLAVFTLAAMTRFRAGTAGDARTRGCFQGYQQSRRVLAHRALTRPALVC